MVEMAESKAKLRKLRQQLEEKTEQLAECKVDRNKDLFHILFKSLKQGFGAVEFYSWLPAPQFWLPKLKI